MVPRERKRPNATAGDERKMIALKIRPSELERIDEAAKRSEMTRTDYIIRKSLGQPVGDEGYDDRLDALERRMSRLEGLSGLD